MSSVAVDDAGGLRAVDEVAEAPAPGRRGARAGRPPPRGRGGRPRRPRAAWPGRVARRRVTRCEPTVRQDVGGPALEAVLGEQLVELVAGAAADGLGQQLGLAGVAAVDGAGGEPGPAGDLRPRRPRRSPARRTPRPPPPAAGWRCPRWWFGRIARWRWQRCWVGARRWWRRAERWTGSASNDNRRGDDGWPAGRLALRAPQRWPERPASAAVGRGDRRKARKHRRGVHNAERRRWPRPTSDAWRAKHPGGAWYARTSTSRRARRGIRAPHSPPRVVPHRPQPPRGASPPPTDGSPRRSERLRACRAGRTSDGERANASAQSSTGFGARWSSRRSAGI